MKFVAHTYIIQMYTYNFLSKFFHTLKYVLLVEEAYGPGGELNFRNWAAYTLVWFDRPHYQYSAHVWRTDVDCFVSPFFLEKLSLFLCYKQIVCSFLAASDSGEQKKRKESH
jgi:hypothetical protein